MKWVMWVLLPITIVSCFQWQWSAHRLRLTETATDLASANDGEEIDVQLTDADKSKPAQLADAKIERLGQRRYQWFFDNSMGWIVRYRLTAKDPTKPLAKIWNIKANDGYSSQELDIAIYAANDWHFAKHKKIDGDGEVFTIGGRGDIHYPPEISIGDSPRHHHKDTTHADVLTTTIDLYFHKGKLPRRNVPKGTP